jgi:hypothetical protein
MALDGSSVPVTLTELASGVDALYLSGRGAVPASLVSALEALRTEAEQADEPVAFDVAGNQFWVEPRSFGKYRYRLVHPAGLVGITTSQHLPTLRVQPRAEYLHGVGPMGVLSFFHDVGRSLTEGPVAWSLSRLDLFCDVQGWDLAGDDRHRFVCRATRRDLHEVGEAFTGFEFGQRSTKTVCARIYDKSHQVEKKGLDWWRDVWGSRYDRSKPVLRIELEIGRKGLGEYKIHSPVDGLERAGSVWRSATAEWLTYRTPTEDGTRSRWPIAPEWAKVQQASLAEDAAGIDRVRAGRRRGELRKLMPAFVGYLAHVAALSGADDLPSALGSARHLVRLDEDRRGIPFTDRVASMVAEEARR